MKLFDEVATKIVAGDPDTPGTLATVHELGFDGRDVIVAVADSGLDSGDVNDMHPDLAERVEALFAYDGLPDASDEHSHGTHCAGIVAGNAASGELDDSGFLWVSVTSAACMVCKPALLVCVPDTLGAVTKLNTAGFVLPVMRMVCSSVAVLLVFTVMIK